MSDIVVKAEKLVRRLAGDVPVTLVDEVSLDIAVGEFVAITGPSGSGKSSVLYLLGLLDPPTSGRLFLNGIETSRLDDDELADLRLAEIGFVFQSFFLLPEFSALENVMLPMQRLGRLSGSAMRERAARLLTELDLAEQLHKLPRQLSGGQSQRVAIARALANEPRLVLADEPTGNLDAHASQNVMRIVRDLAHGGDRAVVVVTHEPSFAESADRMITIIDGKIWTPAEDRKAPAALLPANAPLSGG